MKAYEVPMKVTDQGTLKIPSEIARALKKEEVVRVIILVSEPSDEHAAWSRMTAEQFLAGYAEMDAVYDRQG
jgi:bifunctional DNA-binding transcriptional regulator/antitoxin component of YhaV-PrlF toxin-antitoxin module